MNPPDQEFSSVTRVADGLEMCPQSGVWIPLVMPPAHLVEAALDAPADTPRDAQEGLVQTPGHYGFAITKDNHRRVLMGG